MNKRGSAAWGCTWPGRIHPYVRTTQRQKWVDKRYKRYSAWKNAFSLFLNTKGFPSELVKGRRYRLYISVFVSGKLNCDGDNIIKAVMDAAWKQDRQIKMIEYFVEEDSKSPEICDIVLEELE